MSAQAGLDIPGNRILRTNDKRPLQRHLGGLVYLGLIGAALTYSLWFRGLARLGPATVSLLALTSPVTAVGIGWLALDQHLTVVQGLGVAVVLLSVAWGQRAAARPGTLAAPLLAGATRAASL